MSGMRDDIETVLLTEEQLRTRTAELGAMISKDFAGREPLFVGVLKGCFVFMADLMRFVTIPCAMDFMAVSSYGTGVRSSSGIVRIVKDLDQPIEGRDVLVVEDIIDSGNTLSYLLKVLGERKPASLKLCTLLDKPSRREVDVHVDYVGFEIEDKFVLGYGLDYDQIYRNLPYVGVKEG